jgi:hypothetical protein
MITGIIFRQVSIAAESRGVSVGILGMRTVECPEVQMDGAYHNTSYLYYN